MVLLKIFIRSLVDAINEWQYGKSIVTFVTFCYLSFISDKEWAFSKFQDSGGR